MKRRAERGVCGLVLCVALTVGVPHAAGAQDPSWLGCYQVDRDGWDWPRENEDSTQFQPPEVLQLLPEIQADWPGGFEVRPSIVSYWTAPGRWRALAPDSISIVWSNGYTGLLMEVGRLEDSLIGTLSAFTDNGPMLIAGVRVVLTPTSCDRLRGGSANG